MLRTKNKFDKSEGKYECDRCKNTMNINDRYSVYIGKGTINAKKKWDLCSRCYRALERGIEKTK